MESISGILCFDKDSEWRDCFFRIDPDVFLSDKEKIQTLIAQQRINLADVDYLDLDSVEKIIHDFENFKNISGRNSEISQKNILEPERRNPYLTMPIDIVRRHAETGVQLAKDVLQKRTEEKQNEAGLEQPKDKKEEKPGGMRVGQDSLHEIHPAFDDALERQIKGELPDGMFILLENRPIFCSGPAFPISQ